MKKSIISAVAASSILYANVNAINPNIGKTIFKNNTEMADTDLNQLYQWRIETESGIFTGVCESIDEINDEIKQLTKNDKVITKNITPISLGKFVKGEKTYTWTVITKSGYAIGASPSLDEAKNMINSFGVKKVLESNIIESKTLMK
tara:strand:- start:11412 stop:11852 length:441 start_codon:yes stop_codon:yes gene_type:complete